MHIIDITQPLLSCEVYPGDTAPSSKRVKTIERDGYNLTDITICVHNGTHIDAPLHFIAGGAGADGLDLSAFYGGCTVAQFSGEIGAAELAPVLADCAERLLLKGGVLTLAAAELLAESRVRLVGVETQSVGTDGDMAAVHKTLLAAGIIPLEGLRLGEAETGNGKYTLAAFPLNLAGADGSPVRAVLVERK
ncbi:MAG: cyclase family protein [Oscillospiraceae bacterium]|jgi:arylformamidase|nr:cyclase family protein [Oscillospiraceae bacterium]